MPYFVFEVYMLQVKVIDVITIPTSLSILYMIKIIMLHITTQLK